MTPLHIILVPLLFCKTDSLTLHLAPLQQNSITAHALLTPNQPYSTTTPQKTRHTRLFAGGFGKPSANKSNSNKSSKPTKSTKKKLQVQERILQAYGGDIARGTQERINEAIASLPPHERSIADLYRKVAQWDAHLSSLSPERTEQLKSQDVQNALAARAEMTRLCSLNGWTEGDAHNVMQRITWDASADAKAAKASVGFMPDHIQKRVDRACIEIADSVKSAKRDGKRSGRCLDVGCGHGTLVPELTKFGVSPGQIVGVDLSPEMVRNAMETYRGVKFVAGDFLGTFEDDGGFDGIIFCSALHDLPDMNGGLAKAASLLRPEGRLVILHAQGCAHVMGQHKANPVLVKRGLPSRQELEVIVVELGLELIHAPAELGSAEDSEEGYLTILKKVA